MKNRRRRARGRRDGGREGRRGWREAEYLCLEGGIYLPLCIFSLSIVSIHAPLVVLYRSIARASSIVELNEWHHHLHLLLFLVLLHLFLLHLHQLQEGDWDYLLLNGSLTPFHLPIHYLLLWIRSLLLLLVHLTGVLPLVGYHKGMTGKIINLLFLSRMSAKNRIYLGRMEK